MKTRLVIALLLLSVTPASAQQIDAWREMNRPVEPFRIADDLYYVGASSVTAFLVTTDEGHVLIDGGFVETAPMIRANVEALGFDLADVKILLNSHGHLDHAGGLARLKAWTGAEMIASRLEAPLLEGGGRGDPVLGADATYPPVEVDRRLEHGESFTLGGKTFTAHVTAGHTVGCTSWAFPVVDGGRERPAVSICSLSILDGMGPDVEAGFRASFATLRGLACDVFLASHAGFFRMQRKRARLAEGGPNPFVDPDGYRAYIDRAEARLDAWLAE